MGGPRREEVWREYDEAVKAVCRGELPSPNGVITLIVGCLSFLIIGILLRWLVGAMGLL